MACCKTCCGCKDCTPGQSGKCCCGGASGTCCTTAQTCCGGSCCENVCCNGVCCPTGQVCCGGKCCDPSKCCNGVCCPEGRVCCNGVCCPEGQECINGVCGEPNCECPSLCLYKIEVVSPLPAGPRPVRPCEDGDPHFVYGYSPAQYGGCGFFEPVWQEVSGAGGAANYLSANYDINGERPGAPNASAIVSVYCVGRKLVVSVLLSISVPDVGPPSRSIVKSAVFELPSSCYVRSNAACGNLQGVLANYINAPITITVSSASAGLGPWQDVSEQSNGPQDEIAPCFASVEAAFQVQFRITQRDKCCEDAYICNGICCQYDQICVDGVCIPICPPGTRYCFFPDFVRDCNAGCFTEQEIQDIGVCYSSYIECLDFMMP